MRKRDPKQIKKYLITRNTKRLNEVNVKNLSNQQKIDIINWINKNQFDSLNNRTVLINNYSNLFSKNIKQIFSHEISSENSNTSIRTEWTPEIVTISYEGFSSNILDNDLYREAFGANYIKNHCYNISTEKDDELTKRLKELAEKILADPVENYSKEDVTILLLTCAYKFEQLNSQKDKNIFHSFWYSTNNKKV